MKRKTDKQVIRAIANAFAQKLTEVIYAEAEDRVRREVLAAFGVKP